jgi:hypothetical protein
LRPSDFEQSLEQLTIVSFLSHILSPQKALTDVTKEINNKSQIFI